MKIHITDAKTKKTEIKEMTSEEETLQNELIAQTKISENKFEEREQAKEDLKLSAKTKLMNGEALTEEEANVMVGL